MALNRELTVKTRMEDLDLVDDALSDFASQEDWPEKFTNQVKLVMEELVVNIVNYAHDDGGLHDIQISIDSKEDVVTLGIMDDGKPFDPLREAPEPNAEGDVESRAIGGLGIHLVMKLTDMIDYQYADGMNQLKITKRRGS